MRAGWGGDRHAPLTGVDVRSENDGKEAPRLRRFLGRPHDLSPKARIKSWLGFGFPFDRHDWVVDRGDGSQNRYIIDFYFDAKTNDSAAAGVDAIHVDVRPALDSVGAVVDRLRLLPERMAAALRRKWVFVDGRDEGAVPREVNMALGQRVRCGARGWVEGWGWGGRSTAITYAGPPRCPPVVPQAWRRRCSWRSRRSVASCARH